MEEMKSQMEEVSGKMKDMGETMTKGLTVPLAGIGAAGVVMATDTSNALGRIQAGLGFTADEAKGLHDAAKDLWKKGFGENVSAVADDLVKVKQNLFGIASDGDIEEITQQAYILSDAFGADVADSSKTAATMMKNFGIKGQEAMDLITLGFQQGGDFSGELLDTLNEYAPAFSSMGISAKDAMGILLAGADAGAFNLDKVGDAMKEFNIRAKDGSDSTAEGFKAIGLNAKQMGTAIAKGGKDGENAFIATVTALASMKDPMKQNAAGVALFGTQWEDLEKNVIPSLVNGIGSIGDGVEGQAKRAGDALNSGLGNTAKKVWREFLSAVEPVGQVLIDLASKVLPPLATALGTVAKWFGELPTGMQTAIIAFGVLLAAIGPLLVMIGSLVEAVVTLMPLWTAIGGVFSAVASIGIWPLIGIIAGLIAIGVLLYKNWETVKAYAVQVWNAIYSNVIKPVIDAIVKFVTQQLDKIKAFWDQNGKQIMQAAKNIWDFVSGIIKGQLQVIKGIFEAVWPVISGVVQVAWGVIKNIVSTTIDVVLGIIKTFAKIFTGDWKGAWESAKQIAKDIWNGITGILKGIDLASIGKDIINGLIKGLKSMMGGITDIVKKIAGLIPKGVKDFLGIHSPSKVMMELGGYTGEGFVNGILGQVKAVKDATQSLGMSAVNLSSSNDYLATGSGQPFILDMDGRQLAKAVMPYIVSEIRQKTGIKLV
jgi:TP901 family phage tail tape measure protein